VSGECSPSGVLSRGRDGCERASALADAELGLELGDLLLHRLTQCGALVRLHRVQPGLERFELRLLLLRVALDGSVVGLLSFEGTHGVVHSCREDRTSTV